MLDGLSLDPHAILGVPRGATAEEIREAFRRKSMKHHPDHGGDDWAFQVVLHAYKTLLPAAEAGSRPHPAGTSGRNGGPPSSTPSGSSPRRACAGGQSAPA